MVLDPEQQELENSLREQKFKALKEVLQNSPKLLVTTVCEDNIAIDDLESRIEQLEEKVGELTNDSEESKLG